MSDPATAAILREAAGLDQVIRLAQGLAASGRAVDLAGLDHDIGRLCARVLDLGAGARAHRPRLQRLLSGLEALEAAMRATAPA